MFVELLCIALVIFVIVRSRRVTQEYDDQQHLGQRPRQLTTVRSRHAFRMPRSTYSKEDFAPSTHDIYHAAFLLRTVLPHGADLIPSILDYAEYWSLDSQCTLDHPRRIAQHNAGDLCCYISLPDSVKKGTVRKIVFKTFSKDQGYSWDRSNHGTYDGSWTWFEGTLFGEQHVVRGRDTTVIGHDTSSGQFHSRVVTNVHAGRELARHEVEWGWDDGNDKIRQRLKNLERGMCVGVTAWARFPAWVNHVEDVRIEVYVSRLRRL